MPSPLMAMSLLFSHLMTLLKSQLNSYLMRIDKNSSKKIGQFIQPPITPLQPNTEKRLTSLIPSSLMVLESKAKLLTLLSLVTSLSKKERSWKTAFSSVAQKSVKRPNSNMSLPIRMSKSRKSKKSWVKKNITPILVLERTSNENLNGSQRISSIL